jgi:predicted Holliday junction resolvase-like endonuclease
MNWEWYLIIILLILLALLVYGFKSLEIRNKKLEDNYNKILSQKKSSEVRLGRIGEQMAPFFQSWPFDPNNFRFLGNPIDGVSFQEDAVYFIEIKTGKARLTESQKLVKKLVKEGKVYFTTFRVSEDGCTFKIEEE